MSKESPIYPVRELLQNKFDEIFQLTGRRGKGGCFPRPLRILSPYLSPPFPSSTTSSRHSLDLCFCFGWNSLIFERFNQQSQSLPKKLKFRFHRFRIRDVRIRSGRGWEEVIIFPSVLVGKSFKKLPVTALLSLSISVRRELNKQNTNNAILNVEVWLAAQYRSRFLGSQGMRAETVIAFEDIRDFIFRYDMTMCSHKTLHCWKAAGAEYFYTLFLL